MGGVGAIVVGLLLGVCVGASVGAGVGGSVGSSVGAGVGAAVGNRDGRLDGLDVGLLVGLLDVGARVVGPGVASNVPPRHIHNIGNFIVHPLSSLLPSWSWTNPVKHPFVVQSSHAPYKSEASPIQ